MSLSPISSSIIHHKFRFADGELYVPAVVADQFTSINSALVCLGILGLFQWSFNFLRHAEQAWLMYYFVCEVIVQNHEVN